MYIYMYMHIYIYNHIWKKLLIHRNQKQEPTGTNTTGTQQNKSWPSEKIGSLLVDLDTQLFTNQHMYRHHKSSQVPDTSIKDIIKNQCLELFIKIGKKQKQTEQMEKY